MKTGDSLSFDDFDGGLRSDGGMTGGKELEAIYDIPVQVSAVLGKSTMQVSQLLKLGRGAVVELDCHLKDPTDVYVEGVLVARGEVVIVDDKIGVTLTDFVKSSREWKR